MRYCLRMIGSLDWLSKTFVCLFKHLLYFVVSEIPAHKVKENTPLKSCSHLTSNALTLYG